MSRFYFEPASICQLSCKLCPSQNFDSSRKGIMDFDKYTSLIEQSISEGYLVTGDEAHLYGFGEPTLHPRLSEMIEILSKHNISTKINTNGVSLDKKVWEKLTESGLTKCLVSLDGIDEETYQRYRVGGDYNQVISNLKFACQHPSNTEIEVQMIVFSYNAHQIDDFIRIVKDIGAHIATIKKARRWDGSDVTFSLDNIPNEYKREFEGAECRFSDDLGVVLQDGSLTLCTSDPFGRYSVGNIFEMGPSLWLSDRFKELKNKKKSLSICKYCGYDNLYAKKIRLRE